MSKKNYVEKLNKILSFNGNEKHYSIIWKSLQTQRLILVNSYKLIRKKAI